MRIILGALALVALTGAGHPGKPVFEFKEFRAGEIIPAERLRRCKDEGSEITCFETRDRVAGVKASTFIHVYGEKLSAVSALFDRDDYPAVALALRAKYGDPCENRSTKVQNRMGADFDNRIFVWCFATGELELREMVGKVSQSGFGYEDDNRPPAKAPTVDF